MSDPTHIEGCVFCALAHFFRRASAWAGARRAESLADPRERDERRATAEALRFLGAPFCADAVEDRSARPGLAQKLLRSAAYSETRDWAEVATARAALDGAERWEL